MLKSPSSARFMVQKACRDSRVRQFYAAHIKTAASGLFDQMEVSPVGKNPRGRGQAEIIAIDIPTRSGTVGRQTGISAQILADFAVWRLPTRIFVM